MNLQELQTIKQNNLPIKIFLLNNQGYSSIKQTQTAFFDKDFIGCNDKSGISFPDNSKLADLYNLAYFKIQSTFSMKESIEAVLSHRGPVLCEVILKHNYVFAPKLSSEKMHDGRIISKPLEDLSPLLARNEFSSNMIFQNA